MLSNLLLLATVNAIALPAADPEPKPVPGTVTSGAITAIVDELEQLAKNISIPNSKKLFGGLFPTIADLAVNFVRHQVVQLPYGQIQGTVEPLFSSYLNIPYAQPPVGALRFKPPQPPLNFSGVYNATSYGNACIQAQTGATNLVTSEDCLNLNVYAPTVGEKLPVIVYIYGGSFNSGYNSNPLYNGKTILTHSNNVVVVTVNYRVGAFGFLAGNLLAQEGSLNVGLLDQKFAFEWVRKNIALFGGDPTRVTAVGQSAGAISLGAHLLAQGGTQTLFDRAVLLSGGPAWLYQTPASFDGVFTAFANAVGCSSGDILGCLRNVPAQTLFTAGQTINWFPIADGSYVNEEALVTLLVDKKVSKVPLLMNDDLNEGTLFSFGQITSAQQVIPYDMIFLPFLTAAQQQTVSALYNVSTYPLGPYQAAGDFFGDLLFQCPEILLASVYQSLGVETYRSSFTHQPLIPLYPSATQLGVYHGAELPFVWQNTALLDSTEIPLSNQVLNSILNFVNGLQPNPNWATYGSGNRYNFVNNAMEPDNERQQKCGFFEQTVTSFLQGQ
ncbi:Carboxylic ester hydrolase [Boothiomyces sp. JEL0838]|nr:Carboxylic ester hydrolase [Boothiomyces sp. JEL0838]